MGALHELAECHDWDGVKELLLEAHQRDKDQHQHQDEDENACENGRNNSFLKQLVSTQDTEGELVVHYPELYQSGVSGDIVKIIIHAYPQALSQPRSADTLHYPLHVALETMLLQPPQKYLANDHNGHHEDLSDNENYYSRVFSQTITEMLSVASEIAEKRNRSGFLPLHYAAQLNNQDVFEQVWQAYPEAASECNSLYNAFPLHFACQSSCPASLSRISQLLQAHPAAAQEQEWSTGMLQDPKENIQDRDGDADTEADAELVPNRFPLHHICANQELFATRYTTTNTSSITCLALFKAVYEAYKPAAEMQDDMGRTPLSLLCQHLDLLGNPLNRNNARSQGFNSTSSLAALMFLSEHQNPKVAAIQDFNGRLPLHYLADHVRRAKFDQRVNGWWKLMLKIWKGVVQAHPSALFQEDDYGTTPIAIFMCPAGRGRSESADDVDGPSRRVTSSFCLMICEILHVSYQCMCGIDENGEQANNTLSPHDGSSMPNTATMPQLLAFFAMALHPCKRQELLQKAIDAHHASMTTIKEHQRRKRRYSIDLQQEAESINQGDTMLHMLCHGLGYWKISLALSNVEQHNHEKVCGSLCVTRREMMDLDMIRKPSNEGQLPFLQAQKQQEHIVKVLVRAFPESAIIPDPISGLMPFMMVSSSIAVPTSSQNDPTHTISKGEVSPSASLTATYHLLQNFVALSDLAQVQVARQESARASSTSTQRANASVKRRRIIFCSELVVSVEEVCTIVT
jgi:ankyrin repeat protein